MAVDTKRVDGRRNVRYRSFNDVLNDAEALVLTEQRTLGNWSLGQILWHLGRSMDESIDGFPMQLPWPMRLLVRLMMKQRLLVGPLPAGIEMPRKAQRPPIEVDVRDALATLREAIARQQKSTSRVPHPVLGRISHEDWTQAHLRHAELHMSFVLPLGITENDANRRSGNCGFLAEHGEQRSTKPNPFNTLD